MKNVQRNHPLVSVIIPNYNHARYLDQRLESILNQTYRNIEVIILDDCSTDNSLEVIQKYKSDVRVVKVVVNERNSGNTFLQWDKGLHFAKGELVWIAESDDYCECDFLQICINRFSENENASIVYVSSILVDAEGNETGTEDVAVRIPDGTFCGKSFIQEYMCLGNSIWNASAVVFNKNNALSLDKGFTAYKATGDHLFWVEMAEMGDVVHCAAKLNYFRQHTQKVTPTKYRQGVTHVEELNVIKYIYLHGLIDRGLKSRIMMHFLMQIMTFEYDTEIIRGKVLSNWRNFDGMLYLECRCKIFLSNLKKRVLNILNI